MILFRPFPVLTLCALPCLALLMTLGVWQLGRAREKADLIATLATAQAKAPADLEDWLGSAQSPQASEWRRFAWSPDALQIDASVLVQTPRAHICTWLIPLQTRQGAILLEAALVTCPPTPRNDEQAANFDNIEADHRHFWAAELLRQLPPSPVAILRATPRKGVFTLKSSPQKALYYYVDADVILRTLELPRALPGFFLANPSLPFLRDPPQAASPSPNPAQELKLAAQPNPHADEAGSQRIGPETHLGYAFTWFGFGATLIWVYLGFHVRAGRLSIRRKDQTLSEKPGLRP